MNLDELKLSLKQLLVEGLKLDHVSAADIKDSEPIFVEGLGLDSIDALELIVLLQQEYKIRLSNAEDGPKVFRSVRTMAEYITTHQGQTA